MVYVLVTSNNFSTGFKVGRSTGRIAPYLVGKAVTNVGKRRYQEVSEKRLVSRKLFMRGFRSGYNF